MRGVLKWVVGVLLSVVGTLLLMWAGHVDRDLEAAQMLSSRVATVEVMQQATDKRLDAILAELQSIHAEQTEMYKTLARHLDKRR